jgi:monoamine oxidase
MSRSTMFDRLVRTLRRAEWIERRGMPSREGVEMIAQAERDARAGTLTRRGLLGVFGAATAAGIAGCAPGADAIGQAVQGARGGNGGPTGDVAIVGAGLAGLGCADELQRRGVTPTLYEAADRVGGRCWSLRGVFPGQVAERGGELIDTTHSTMRGWARDFGVELESFQNLPGDEFYYFGGQRHDEAAVVEEYRAFVDAMRADLRTVGSPTALDHTAADEALDRMTLRDYLISRGAGPLLRPLIEVVYNIEYGVEADQQSALSFLLFIHADRRGRFQPFGIFSDERFHVIDGNDRIATGLHGRLARPAEFGMRLVRVARTAAGRVALTFLNGRRTVVKTHDRAVLTLPSPALRNVELHASLALPDWKLRAIRELRYGTNAKLMVGFTSRPWVTQGGNGGTYSDLANLQATWETNPARATAAQAIITDYTGGDLGARLNPANVPADVARFLADFDRVVPGANAAARRSGNGAVLAHLEHWPSNPLTLGSYTANHPGYFTTIADLEGTPVDNLHFAGEHTSSFYEWQGFMEGAALSGLRAAGEVYDALRGR